MLFRKAEETNKKNEKNKQKYYYTKIINTKLNKDIPWISNVPSETPLKTLIKK